MVTYRVQAEDAGDTLRPWCQGSAIQLPETFLAFTECGSGVTNAGSVATKTAGGTGWTNSAAVIGSSLTDGVHCWEVQVTGDHRNGHGRCLQRRGGHTGVAGPAKRCRDIAAPGSSVTVLPNVLFR